MLVDRPAFDTVDGGGRFVLGKELDRSDAIPSDLCQQIESREGRRSVPPPDPLADLARIREEIVEVGRHRLATI